MSRRNSLLSQTRKREHNHIQSSSMVLEDVDYRFQVLLQKIEPMRLGILQYYQEDEEGQTRNLEHRLEEYEERINSFENRTQQILTHQLEAFRDESETFQAVIWNKATTLINQQSEWMQEAIKQERAAQQSIVDELEDSYKDLQKTIDHRKEFAAQALEFAKGLFISLNTQYKPEPSWQNALPGFELKLRQAECNLEMGFEETALAGAQQLTQEMTDLRYQMEAFIHQRQLSIASVRRLAERLRNFINRSRYVRAIDMEERPLSKILDVDYWVGGQLRQLYRQVNGILRQVNQPPAFLKLDEIDRLGQQLVSLREQVQDVILQARVQAISSQMRANIAENALAAMRSQGYELIAGGFHGSDMRQAYRLEMGNLADSQVIIEVSPVNEKPLIQNLSLQTKEKEPLTDHEVQQRHNELNQALQWYGLNTGDIVGPERFPKNYPITKTNSSRLHPIPMAII